MKKIIIWAFFLCFCVVSAQTPTFTGKQITTSANKVASSKIHQSMKAMTTNFKIYELDLSAIHNHLKQSKSKTSSTSFKVDLGKEHQWELHLTPYDVYAPDFRKTVQTATGVKTDYTRPEVFTYRGYNRKTNNTVTISIKDGWFYGHISEGSGQDYFIEPTAIHDAKSSSQRFVVYKTTDVTQDSYTCRQNRQPTESEKMNSENTKVLAVQCAEIAIAYDQSMKNYLGSTANVENTLTSRFNNLSQYFLDKFQIDKKLIEFYESANNEITPDNNTTPCNEQFPNCSNGTILDDFREWGEKENNPNSGFTSDPDAATFYTGRGVTSYYGYSHFEGICNSRGYNWVEERLSSFSESKKISLWAHEYGHTWNAYHVSGSQYLMLSSVTNTYPPQVSNSTNTSVINHKNAVPCLSTGSCGNTSPCNNGDSVTVTIQNQTDCTLQYTVNNQSQGSINAGQSASKTTAIGANWVAKTAQGTTVDSFNIVCNTTTYTSQGSCTTIGDPCNGGATLSGISGNIEDGSGASNYGNNKNCTWLIQPSDGKRVKLTFNNFSTEANYDFVYVYDGQNASAIQLGKFSGNNTPPVLTSSGNALFVRFTTDTNTIAAGWAASYVTVDSSAPTCNDGIQNGDETGIDCGGSCAPCSVNGGDPCNGGATYTTASGSIEDGSGSSNYGNNKDCTWLIKPSSGGRVTLTFNSFSTEANYDYVYVYDGQNTSATRLGRFSGRNIPRSLTSSGNALFVRFTTDTNTIAAGWSASYTTAASIMGASVNYMDSEQLTVSPNPASSYVKVSYNAMTGSDTSILVTNLRGVILKRVKLMANKNTGEIRINTDHLSNGFYLLQVKTNNKTSVQQFIVRN